MAGDWIPITKDLPQRLEVRLIAQRAGRSRREVVAILLEFWIWADSETEDGILPGLSVLSLATFHADTDETFWSAVVTVGWLVETPTGLLIPNFDRWLGHCAKRRLRQNESKRQSRIRGRQSGDSVATRMATSDVATVKTECRPQNRTEENTKSPPPPLGGKGDVADDEGEQDAPADTLADVRAAGTSGAARRDTLSDRPDLLPVAKRIIAHYQRVVAPAYAPKNHAASVVTALLIRGLTEQQLTLAADRYAELNRRNEVEPKSRRVVHLFYQVEKGSYQQFLEAPEQPKKPYVPVKKPRPEDYQ